MRQFLVVETPGAAPIDLDGVKAQLKIETTEFDTILTSYIATALAIVDGAEGCLGRALLTQTWTLNRDLFVDYCGHNRHHRHLFPGEIVLPLAPLQSITSVKYRDVGNVLQTISPSIYRVINRGTMPSSIMPVLGQWWPTTALLDPEAVQIKIQCGYGPAATAVPEPIKQAMLLMIGDWFQSREAATLDNLTKDARFCVDALLSNYRTSWV